MGSIVNATSAFVEDSNSNKISLIRQKPFPDTTYINSLFRSTNLNLNYNGTYGNLSGNVYSMSITGQTDNTHSVSYQDLVNSPFNAIQFSNYYSDYTIYSNQLPLQYQYAYVNNTNIIIKDSSYNTFSVTIPISALKPNSTYTATCAAGFSANSDGSGGMNICETFYFTMSTNATGMPNSSNFATTRFYAGNGNNTTWNYSGWYTFSNNNIADLAVQTFNNPNLNSYSNSPWGTLIPQSIPSVNAIIY